MKCSKCGNECVAHAEPQHGSKTWIAGNHIAVSDCCGAYMNPEEDQEHGFYHKIPPTIDMTHDEWQGCNHYLSGVTGYPRSEKTLRDEIAIEAMKEIIKLPQSPVFDPSFNYSNGIAKESYEIADAMMEARSK